ncbi:hypothetical protein EV667_4357 [Ancylobacter aquaticus]|uniref:Tc toxin complex TcA C-terminal TcB-binding domain-containing protein n=1 Tax=Ancylobacter aquaticus TaxID=100 RepID=A0A4R1H6I4_ANCAQ|nr:toxin [Ancylobacter aquaticus]TCK16758.1 hypothetical protein EV667_4357 [Ancylobacter aquaticus]
MLVSSSAYSFHDYRLVDLARRFETVTRPDVEFTYTFDAFFHPLVHRLVEELNRRSLPGLLDADFHAALAADFFAAAYKPQAEDRQVAYGTFPRKEIDLSPGGAYSVYNWELLFHLPVTIAVHLSKNQRFAEAMRWFHFVFDPTSTDTSHPPPQRYWRFLRFREATDSHQLDELLTLLSKPDPECSQVELDEKLRVLEGYEAIRNHPFQPHRVARTRLIAYQYSVVMRYLDNLIAWGDQLFSQDTIETINEASQRYVLAANLLGPRPERVPARGQVRTRNYRELKAAGLDALGNALVDLEGKFPFNTSAPSSRPQAPQSGPLFGIGRTLYFCIPQNEKLLAYWDTVDDRLTKIRNCMNIKGVVRSLALFDPPLDPGMMVRATAAGIDIGALTAGLNQPIGPVRAQAMIRRALELANEVRSLGGTLLSAIEKQDGESLALLRQDQETRVQEMSREVRYLQWKQAEEATESLLRSRASTLERYDYALRQLGLHRDAAALPDTFTLGERREITEANFDGALSALVSEYDRPVSLQNYPALQLAGESAPDQAAGAVGKGLLYLNAKENADVNTHGPAAQGIRKKSMTADLVSAVMAMIPDMGIDLHFWGMGGHANIFGGSALSSAGRFYSQVKGMDAVSEESQGMVSSKLSGFERRADDWMQQANLAGRELAQIGRQIVGALIAEQGARKEYDVVGTQIEHTRDVDRFLRGKFSSAELYGWMQGELSRLCHDYYRFALDTARKAERTVKHELMRAEIDDVSFIRPDHWNAGRRGLLAGEGLHLDLKRLEAAYDENNRREFELTRQVSLRQLNPAALLTLRATGRCRFDIPEAFLDMDGVHIHRRLRSVALSLPAVVGPYTPLHATLTLQRSSIRTSAQLRDGAYARQGEDNRFVDYLGSSEQIVTSSAVADAGLFEPTFRGESTLPFEGAGVVSSWQLDLPREFPSFDRESLADAVLHLRYTARQGGELLATQAATELRAALEEAGTAGLALLFTLAQDFAMDWAAFVHGTSDLSLTLRRTDFPYVTRGRDIALDGITFFAPSNGRLQRRDLLLRETDAARLDELSDSLSADPGEAVVGAAADSSVLRREADRAVCLLVRYHLA